MSRVQPDAGAREAISPSGALSASEERFWRGLMRALVVLPRGLDADLARDAGLGLSEYTVLVHLSEAPDRTLRMNDLAGRMAFSPGYVTRLVNTLVQAHYLTRSPCASDARGVVVSLTEQGLSRLNQAWPVHLDSVRRRVVDRVRPEHLVPFAEVLEQVAVEAEQPDCTAFSPD